MSKQYHEVAKKLGVHYLFGRWGISFYSHMPEGNKIWQPKFVPLNGWTFDEKEIIEAIANDPDMAISYGDKQS